MIPVTALSEYIYCPRKCYISLVMGKEEPPKEVVLKGTIRHAIFDKINKVDESLVKDISAPMNYEEILSIYKKTYHELLMKVILNYKKDITALGLDQMELFQEMWSSFLSEAEIRTKTISDFIKEKKVYGKELWDSLTPKFLTEYKLLSAALNLTGVVDRIEIHNDKYIPVELKTGKTLEREFGQAIRCRLQHIS